MNWSYCLAKKKNLFKSASLDQIKTLFIYYIGQNTGKTKKEKAEVVFGE